MDYTLGAEIAQTVAIVGGGLWALFLYLQGRRGQVRVGIDPSVRLLPDWNENRAVLLVRFRIVNSSRVLYRHREATATLMDARKLAGEGVVRLVPFIQADPFLPVYGDITDDPEMLASGDTFVLEDSELTLEPGEHVDTEVSFVLDQSKLGLMAIQVLIMGCQGKRSKRPHWWGTFFYVDPAGPQPMPLGLTDTMERR
jgi:hypothetical protein